MPATGGNSIRTIGDVIMVLTQCTKPIADAAEIEVCKDPKSVAILLIACGISTAGVGYGGMLIVGGAATGGSTVIPGLALTSSSLYAAKKVCSAAVRKATNNIDAK